MNYTFELLMCAYVRGYAMKNGLSIDKNLIEKDIFELSDYDILELKNIALKYNLKTTAFEYC